VVVLAAAKVGGIHANAPYPADFLLDNLKIQTNVIETAWRSGVRRLLFLGSSCIYPKFAEQPIREEALLSRPRPRHELCWGLHQECSHLCAVRTELENRRWNDLVCLCLEATPPERCTGPPVARES